MNKLSISDLELRDRRVLIRVDFNVPFHDGKIADDTRIKGALPTIKYAVEKDAKVILCSHLGRPPGVVEKRFSLKPVSSRLSEIIGNEVLFVEDCIGDEVKNKISALRSGSIILLENVRFHKGEKTNNKDFARKLADLAHIYINDAFGIAHRTHASTVGVTEFVDKSAAGFLLEKELEILGKVFKKPERPFVAILGGAKVSDKVPIIKSFIDKRVDKLLIGGAMAYTFFKSNGYTVGKSLVEDDMLPIALEIQKMARKAKIELVLPTDHQVVDSFDPLNSNKIMPIDFTNTGQVGLDIGTETSLIFGKALEEAKTIIWNGPMGMFEEKPFDKGTFSIAKAIAKATDKGAFSVVGGGDLVSAIKQSGFADKISHISTGGGAALEFLSGTTLPGVAALDDLTN